MRTCVFVALCVAIAFGANAQKTTGNFKLREKVDKPSRSIAPSQQLKPAVKAQEPNLAKRNRSKVQRPQRPVFDKTTAPDTTKGTPVELLQAIELIGIKKNGQDVKSLKGNDSVRVIFRHAGTILYCDEAIQYPDRNYVEAFGNVYIEQGDSITVVGDSAFYFGNTKVAELHGNVVMKDSTRTITTQLMEYDMRRNLASYHGGGQVVDDSMNLTSQSGYYNTQTEMMSFKGNVIYDSPQSNNHLASDTLTYDTRSRDMFFTSKTYITTKNGNLVTEKGVYNTATGEADFESNAAIDTEDFHIIADQLNFDQRTGKADARGNVILYQKEDSVTIYGDRAKYDRHQGTTWVTGHAMMQRPLGKKDTLFLAADTLYALNDTILNRQEVQAWRNVKIYSHQIEGIADSLSYVANDSLLSFYQDPVLWNGDSQMFADTIRIKLSQESIDTLFLIQKAFMITQNEKQQHNQIKGRDMIAKFIRNSVHKVDVNGNGESVYFVLDSLDFIGMNKVQCSDMVLRFADSNQLSTITFIREPKARFVPPHEIEEPDTKLPGFAWRVHERPGRAFVDSILTRAGVRPQGQMLLTDPIHLFLYEDQLTLFSSVFDSSLIQYPFFIRFIPKAQQINSGDLTAEPPLQIEPEVFQLSKEDFDNGILWKNIDIAGLALSSMVIGQSKEPYGKTRSPEPIWQRQVSIAPQALPKPKASAFKNLPIRKEKAQSKDEGQKGKGTFRPNQSQKKPLSPMGK